MTSEFIQVLTTTESREVAEKIAAALVEQRLAACVQVQGPMLSTYRWQDAVEQAQEWLVVIKTVCNHFAAVEEAIRRLHTYEVPEIIALPIVEGSADYLDWLRAQVRE